LEECGPCPVFAGITLAFALQLRKKHGKTSVSVVKNLRQGSLQLLKKGVHKNFGSCLIENTLLYMFRVVLPPIIRSAYNCIYSIWYFSHRYCYLTLS
jgi:hypothetical protein